MDGLGLLCFEECGTLQSSTQDKPSDDEHDGIMFLGMNECVLTKYRFLLLNLNTLRYGAICMDVHMV